MTYSRKLFLLRVSLAAVTFTLVWLILSVGGSLFINKEEVVNWLAEQKWIKFLSPGISNFIFVYGWQVLAAIIISIFVFRKTKNLCIRLLNIYVKSAPILILAWDKPPHNLPSPEALLFFNTGCESCTLLLKNLSSKDIRVKRMEIYPAVSKGVKSRTGNEITARVKELDFGGGNEEDGLAWKLDQNKKWFIDDVITLKENSKFELPVLDPTFDDENDKITEIIRDLIADPTLSITYDLVVYTDEMPYKLSAELPLRIMRPYEEWDEEYNDAQELLKNIGINDPKEKDKLFQIYTTTGRELFEARKLIEASLNQWQEQEMLKEFEEELQPYDEEIEKDPDDAQAHYSRGHVMIDKGFVYEALSSLDKAMELGLNTPELKLDRALVLYQLSRNDEALRSLDSIDNNWPKNVLFYKVRAQVNDKLERFQEELADYESLMELEPDNADNYIMHALTLTSVSKNNGDAVLTSLKNGIDKGFANNKTLSLFKDLLDREHAAKLKELILILKENETEQG